MLFLPPFCKVMAKKDIPTEILESAKDLFFKHGFKRISIEDICNKAEVSRRTFYMYFYNKTDLLLQLLKEINKENMNHVFALDCSNLPFSEKLIQIVNFQISQLEQMTPEFLADTHDPSFKEVREYYESKKEGSEELLSNFFAEAQKRGELRANLDVEFLYRFIKYAIDSCKDEEIRKLYASPTVLMRKIADLLFYGILGKEN